MKIFKGVRGFSLLLPLIFIYTISALILFAAHFVIERKIAIENLRNIEQSLDQRHRANSRGIWTWKPSLNEESDDPTLSDEVIRQRNEIVGKRYGPPLDGRKQDRIHIDF